MPERFFRAKRRKCDKVPLGCEPAKPYGRVIRARIVVGEYMNRIATISIIVEQSEDENIRRINELLHEYQNVILGRMGLPDRKHNVNIICVALCAEENVINALTGKLGKIDGISAKTLYSKNSY